MPVVGFGLLIGVVMALSGAGGSILAIPLLVFALKLSLTQAAPIALLAVMSAAMVGAAQGLYKGNVRYKTALLIGLVGIVFAPIGVWLTTRIATQLLSVFLALILLHVAWRMWAQPHKIAESVADKPDMPCMINPATSKLFWTAICTKRLMFTGMLSGLLSGMLGVGGGFIIVPSLRKVSNFDMQTVIATSLAIIALVSAGGVAVYLSQGGVHWPIALPFIIGTMVGMSVARLFVHRIPAILSQRCFALLAMVAAGLLIVKALS